MVKNYTTCNFLVPTVRSASVSTRPLSVQIKTRISQDSRYLRLRNIFFPQKVMEEPTSKKVILPQEIDETLNLQAGEWVRGTVN